MTREQPKAELVTIDPRETALARQQTAGIIVAVPSEQLTQAILEYKRVQGALDNAMPDCIMQIQGRQFRKKQYWRGVRMAFNLTVECISEQRVDYPDGDWGYLATYRAMAPNGSSADGDGACMASEKEVRDKRTGEIIAWKTKQAQTVHNVRSHAHTRAQNRAISSLVGFGEVSAEEASREDDEPAPRRDVTPKARDINADMNADAALPGEHHASWKADQGFFFGRLKELNVPDYEKLSTWCVDTKGWPRPSAMARPARDLLLNYLAQRPAARKAPEPPVTAFDGPVETNLTPEQIAENREREEANAALGEGP